MFTGVKRFRNEVNNEKISVLEKLKTSQFTDDYKKDKGKLNEINSILNAVDKTLEKMQGFINNDYIRCVNETSTWHMVDGTTHMKFQLSLTDENMNEILKKSGFRDFESLISERKEIYLEAVLTVTPDESYYTSNIDVHLSVSGAKTSLSISDDEKVLLYNIIDDYFLEQTGEKLSEYLGIAGNSVRDFEIRLPQSHWL